MVFTSQEIGFAGMPAHYGRPRPPVQPFDRPKIFFGFLRLGRGKPVKFRFLNRNGYGFGWSIGRLLGKSLARGEQRNPKYCSLSFHMITSTHIMHSVKRG